MKEYTITADDIRELPKDLGDPDCEECDGTGCVTCSACDGDGATSCGNDCCDGSHKCDECKGDGESTCPECLGKDTRREVSIKAAIAAEATYLWKRDVGRGITAGEMGLYIGFAVESFREAMQAKEAA